MFIRTFGGSTGSGWYRGNDKTGDNYLEIEITEKLYSV